MIAGRESGIPIEDRELTAVEIEWSMAVRRQAREFHEASFREEALAFDMAA